MAHRCISFEEHALHSACASWAGDSQIRALCDEKELRRLDGAPDYAADMPATHPAVVGICLNSGSMRMTPYLPFAEVRKISVRDALKHVRTQKCSHCREPGASVVCSGLCKKRLHRHCLDDSGCDYDQGATSPP